MKIVTIFIQNNQNRLLIQKRSKEKNGRYGITSGHVEENEENVQGAIREIKEELGLDVKKDELKLFFTKKIKGNTYNLYHLKKDINIDNLYLQKNEVDNVQWCTMHEIKDLISKEEFFDNQIEALDIFNRYIEGDKNTKL